MVKNGFHVPTVSTGNSTAQMNQTIRVYLQALANSNLLVSYPFIQEDILLIITWEMMSKKYLEIIISKHSKILAQQYRLITRCGIGTLRRLAHVGNSAQYTENNSHNILKITLAYDSSIPHPPSLKKRQENLLTVKLKSKKFRTVWMKQWWRGF